METKTSALPHVLTEYNPEYEPKIAPRPAPHHGRRCEKDTSPTKIQHQAHAKSHSKRPSAGTADHGLKSSGSRRHGKKTEGERFEDLCHKWEQAKQEVRQEDHELLLEKISLQQELIKRQDEYAQQRREEISDYELQQRESDKAKKLEREEELRKICKQSLEEDRRTVRKEHRSKLKAARDTGPRDDAAPPPSPGSPTKSPGTPGSRHSGGITFFPARQPGKTDVEDIDESEESGEEEDIKDTPWHEQQLYRMYGKNADYFLHPTMLEKQEVKKAHTKLRRYGVDDLSASYWENYENGRAGAEVLWQTLRQDSNARLQKEDASIPQSLKDAYCCFARQALNRNELPVRRMYYVKDDLPEMDKLLDHSASQGVRKMRHQSDLMYRASMSNQDRTEVLTFNNPLPEFNQPKPESINQYLPSWQDDTSEVSEPEYTKYLHQPHTSRTHTIMEEDEDGDPGQPHLDPAQSFDDDLILILARKRGRGPPQQKYVFLSEKDTTVKGEFTEKFRDVQDNKDIPPPYRGARPRAVSAMGLSSSTADQRSASTGHVSAPLPAQDRLLKDYTSGWQPLSMHALVEYKKELSTVGEGDYNLGRTKMWSHIPVVTS